LSSSGPAQSAFSGARFALALGVQEAAELTGARARLPAAQRGAQMRLLGSLLSLEQNDPNLSVPNPSGSVHREASDFVASTLDDFSGQLAADEISVVVRAAMQHFLSKEKFGALRFLAEESRSRGIAAGDQGFIERAQLLGPEDTTFAAEVIRFCADLSRRGISPEAMLGKRLQEFLDRADFVGALDEIDRTAPQLSLPEEERRTMRTSVALIILFTLEPLRAKGETLAALKELDAAGISKVAKAIFDLTGFDEAKASFSSSYITTRPDAEEVKRLLIEKEPSGPDDAAGDFTSRGVFD